MSEKRKKTKDRLVSRGGVRPSIHLVNTSNATIKIFVFPGEMVICAASINTILNGKCEDGLEVPSQESLQVFWQMWQV